MLSWHACSLGSKDLFSFAILVPLSKEQHPNVMRPWMITHRHLKHTPQSVLKSHIRAMNPRWMVGPVSISPKEGNPSESQANPDSNIQQNQCQTKMRRSCDKKCTHLTRLRRSTLFCACLCLVYWFSSVIFHFSLCVFLIYFCHSPCCFSITWLHRMVLSVLTWDLQWPWLNKTTQALTPAAC